MRKFHTHHKYILILMLVSILLSSCQAGSTPTLAAITETPTLKPTITNTPVPTNTPEPTATFTPTPTQVVIRVGPSDFPLDVNPLTGLQVADPTLLDRRPITIKVSNFPREGRPHAGLSSADIVFDYYTGTGGDRFLAIFYGQDAEAVGPIRSGRFIDAQLVPMYQGILAMVSAWAPIYSELVDTLGYRLFGGGADSCPAVCDDGKNTVYSIFGNTSELSKLYTKRYAEDNNRKKLDGMLFDTIPPVDGVAGTQFTMEFYSKNIAEWKFDPSSGKYLRWIESVDLVDDKEVVSMIPLVDRNNGEQLAFSNVIIMLAEITTLNGDDTAHRFGISQIEGRAIAFRDGQKYDILYQTSKNAPIHFYTKNRQPFALQPGNSWIYVIGLNSLIKENEPGVWYSLFGKP